MTMIDKTRLYEVELQVSPWYSVAFVAIATQAAQTCNSPLPLQTGVRQDIWQEPPPTLK